MGPWTGRQQTSADAAYAPGRAPFSLGGRLDLGGTMDQPSLAANPVATATPDIQPKVPIPESVNALDPKELELSQRIKKEDDLGRRLIRNMKMYADSGDTVMVESLGKTLTAMKSHDTKSTIQGIATILHTLNASGATSDSLNRQAAIYADALNVPAKSLMEATKKLSISKVNETDKSGKITESTVAVDTETGKPMMDTKTKIGESFLPKVVGGKGKQIVPITISDVDSAERNLAIISGLTVDGKGIPVPPGTTPGTTSEIAKADREYNDLLTEYNRTHPAKKTKVLKTNPWAIGGGKPSTPPNVIWTR